MAYSSSNRDITRDCEGKEFNYLRDHRPPKKGEYYLKPTGKKGEVIMLQAQNDHIKHNYSIVEPWDSNAKGKN